MQMWFYGFALGMTISGSIWKYYIRIIEVTFPGQTIKEIPRFLLRPAHRSGVRKMRTNSNMQMIMRSQLVNESESM